MTIDEERLWLAVYSGALAEAARQGLCGHLVQQAAQRRADDAVRGSRAA